MPIFCHKNQKVKYPDLFPYSQTISKNQNPICLIQDIYSKTMIKADKDLYDSRIDKERMKKYEVYTTDEFDRDFERLDNSLKIQIDNEIEQLEINPYVGRSLNYKFFREKKVKNFRIYFLVYEEYVVVFVIALSSKKYQQKVIDTIKTLIPYYKEEIKKKLSS